MQNLLDRQVTVVTGGGGGIGRAIATALAAAGAGVAVWDLDGGRAKEVADSLSGRAAGVEVDITSRPSVQRALEITGEGLGAVDVLVNNAGVDRTAPSIDQPIDDFREVLEVNLVAAFDLTRHAARSMIDSGNGGVIVNVASVWALGGIGQIPNAAYARFGGNTAT